MIQDRREFMKGSVRGFVTGCILSRFPGLLAAEHKVKELDEMDAYIGKISEEMTYCAYRCSKTCLILTATLNEDQQLLKEKARVWSKAHDGMEIPEGQFYCYGCKPVNKPLGFIVSSCSVRKCAIEKGYASCAECDKLKTCDQDLWTRYPEHRKYVLKLQREKK